MSVEQHVKSVNQDETSMTTLYIIGNGFDLHHGLPTSLSGFRVYSKYSDFHRLYENGVFMMLDNQCLNEYWNQLEENLANFDVDELIEQKKEYYDDDPHENQFVYEVENAINVLTTGLVKDLHDYLAKAETQTVKPDKLLRLDTRAFFINFNYTNTLERIYNIPSNHICYIHGKLNGPEPIVVGHGMKDSGYEPPLAIDVSTLSEDAMEAYADSYSPDYEYAILEAHEYFQRSYKDTNACLEANSDFLQSLSDIDNVIILGHSLAEIDQLYFDRVNQIVGVKCRWSASYYLSSEQEAMYERLEDIVGDQNRISLFEMYQLTFLNKGND